MNKEKGNVLITDIRKAMPVLRSINWNFYQRSVFAAHEMHPFDCRSHHWFPATFVPEIPFTLIEILTLPGAVVYDPFAGIGTTYFQALLLNRSPVATEICSVAIEYMRSLFTLFDPELDLDSLRQSIKEMLAHFDPSVNYTLKAPGDVLIDRLRPWYTPKTLNQLSFLFLEEADTKDKALKAAIRISISAILKSASSQDRGWGCVADNVLPKPSQMRDKEALNLLERHLDRLLSDISGHLKCAMPGYPELYRELSQRETIFYEDVRDLQKIPDESVDLVVTSPPYPYMTDYITSQRLSYYFLGLDLASRNRPDVDLEIGARSKRRNKDSLDRYLEDMRKANERICQKIKPSGYACYVMPGFAADSENNGNRRRVVQKIISDMDKYDLIKEEEFERILPTIRRSHNIKWATLEREKIHLFKKV